MSFPETFHAAAIAAPRNIDASSGVITGVSVITVGAAKGHGVYVDATTLQQVKECAEKYTGGVKVKMNHSGGAGDIIGYLQKFRIDGKKLIADFFLLRASPHRAYVLEIAKTIPDTFGLSISFSGPREKRGEQSFARCTEIYSADLVSEPAANPSGLFSRGNSKTFEQLVAQEEARFDSKAEAIRFVVGKYPDEHAEYLARGAGPLESTPSTTHATFEDCVRAEITLLRKKLGPRAQVLGAAIRTAVAKNPTLHEQYVARLQAGETSDFSTL